RVDPAAVGEGAGGEVRVGGGGAGGVGRGLTRVAGVALRAMSATAMANRSWSSWTWAAGWRLLVAAALVVPVDRAPASVQALVLVALFAAVGLVGGALAKVLLGDVAARDRKLAAAVLGIAACVVTGDVIGHFGALTGAWFRSVLAVLVVASVLPIAGHVVASTSEWRDSQRLIR